MDRIKIDIPVIVEGKYDVIKLNSIIDGHVIKTDGFSLFKSRETQKYIKKLAEPKGIIVLTDSDGAGLVIRNRISSILPKDKLIHLYPPQIEGKEKRKTAPSKEGYLGVEGLSAHIIRGLFAPFEAHNDTNENKRQITKTDFYNDGLTGKENSAEKRRALQKELGLPSNISANALLEVLNFLYSYDEYKAFLNREDQKK